MITRGSQWELMSCLEISQRLDEPVRDEEVKHPQTDCNNLVEKNVE